MWSFFSRDPTKDFAYEIGEKVPGLEDKSLWTLHDGKRKSNGEPVSIFAFDVKNSSEALVQLAKASFKKIKTLRHPSVLTYLDGLESDRVLYFVTEAVVPLQSYVSNNDPQTPSNQLAVSWGLHQIAKALAFLNNDCNLVHNNVNVASVFVDRAGEWKLGGVDFMYPASGPESQPPIKAFPALEKYDPPERTASGGGRRPSERWSTDMWSLGCLIWEVFNGPFAKNTSLKQLGKIPKPLVANYCELVGANPKSRPSPTQFVDGCMSRGGFMDNKFVSSMLFLHEIQIQDPEAKMNFFNSLPASLDLFPMSFCKLCILPQLINAFEYGNAGSSVLAPLFKLGKMLEADEYQKRIVPCVVKLFSSTDRATRVKLLQQIELFVEHLTPTVVNDQIFPNIVHGFSDTNPVVREHTIKSMVHLAPKLNYKNLNEEVLKHFARLQARDDQGGIRTNTTVCLGKVACYLNPQVRQRVLSSAYLRAIKDPFPPARQAGILAMAATHNYFTLAECAQKLLPSLCCLTTDPEKNVRDQAFRAIKCFLGKLEKVSENPELAADAEKDINTGGSLAASTAGWTGWAVSGMTSLTSKIYKGKDGGGGTQSATAGRPLASPARAPSEGRQVPAAKEPTHLGSGRPPAAATSSAAKPATSAAETASSENHETTDGWDENWDDEDKWGEMEASINEETGRQRTTEGATTSGGGWEDADDWGDLDTSTSSPVKTSHSATNKSQPATSSFSRQPASPQTSFDDSEFAAVEDRSVAPASAYNWDTPNPTVVPAQVDPNSDEFFNSLLVAEKKKSTKASSILKPAGSRQQQPSPTSELSTTMAARSQPGAVAKPTVPATTSRAQPLKTTGGTKDAAAKKKQSKFGVNDEGWDDSNWGDGW